MTEKLDQPIGVTNPLQAQGQENLQEKFDALGHLWSRANLGEKVAAYWRVFTNFTVESRAALIGLVEPDINKMAKLKEKMIKELEAPNCKGDAKKTNEIYAKYARILYARGVTQRTYGEFFAVTGQTQRMPRIGDGEQQTPSRQGGSPSSPVRDVVMPQQQPDAPSSRAEDGLPGGEIPTGEETTQAGTSESTVPLTTPTSFIPSPPAVPHPAPEEVMRQRLDRVKELMDILRTESVAPEERSNLFLEFVEIVTSLDRKTLEAHSQDIFAQDILEKNMSTMHIDEQTLPLLQKLFSSIFHCTATTEDQARRAATLLGELPKNTAFNTLAPMGSEIYVSFQLMYKKFFALAEQMKQTREHPPLVQPLQAQTQMMEFLEQLRPAVPPEMKDGFQFLIDEGAKLGPPPPVWNFEYEQKLISFRNKAIAFETKLIVDLAEELRTDYSTAVKIFEGARNGWKGFYKEEGDIIEQTHDIPKLKIYKLSPDGPLVADYGLQDIGSGTYKRAKTARRLTGPEIMVRLTKTSAIKQRERELLQQIDSEIDGTKKAELQKQLDLLLSTFFRDVEREWKARELLKNADVPNFTQMTRIQYKSKAKPGRPSRIKTRYMMVKYEGNLYSLASSPKLEDGQKALVCCDDVFSSLDVMHATSSEQGGPLVHGDLKTDNILFFGSRGYLNDFGFLTTKGSKSVGDNLVYSAPENVFGKKRESDPAQDMFSVGILLLAIVDPETYDLWAKEVGALKKTMKEDPRLVEVQDLERQLAEHKRNIEIWFASGQITKEDKAARLAKAAEFGAEYKDRKAAILKKYEDQYKILHAGLLKRVEEKRKLFSLDLIIPLLNYDSAKRPTCQEAHAIFRERLPKSYRSDPSV